MAKIRRKGNILSGQTLLSSLAWKLKRNAISLYNMLFLTGKNRRDYESSNQGSSRTCRKASPSRSWLAKRRNDQVKNISEFLL